MFTTSLHTNTRVEHMNIEDIIKQQFNESTQSREALFSLLAPQIAAAGIMLSECLKRGNKILCCGNGGSASDSQHFAAELVGRYVNERPGMPAISLNTDTSALTAIANDYGYNEVFARQIQALAQEQILMVLSTSGNSENIIVAVEEAHKRNMQILALTGKGGGRLSAYLRPGDIIIYSIILLLGSKRRIYL